MRHNAKIQNLGRYKGTMCMEAIDLAITLGEYPISVTRIVEFVVVDIPSTYNLILGRPL